MKKKTKINEAAKRHQKEVHQRELLYAYSQGYRDGGLGASLGMADEINRLTDMVLRSRSEILEHNKKICQDIADRTGREIHTADPKITVKPRGKEQPSKGSEHE